MTNIAAEGARQTEWAPLVGCVIGPDLSRSARALLDDPKVPLVSATGSTRMGRIVGPRVAQRFGKTLLELGGNNALTVHRRLRSRSGRTRNRVRRRRHRRPALHHDPPRAGARRSIIDKLQRQLREGLQASASIGDPFDHQDAGRSVDRRGSRRKAFEAAIKAAKRAGRQASSPAASAPRSPDRS